MLFNLELTQLTSLILLCFLMCRVIIFLFIINSLSSSVTSLTTNTFLTHRPRNSLKTLPYSCVDVCVLFLVTKQNKPALSACICVPSCLATFMCCYVDQLLIDYVLNKICPRVFA